ncbi:hypothetical protein PPL_09729 [Heterostelium album PN500]|uniref:Fe2OG dioxygenase domain-containing protein n=1 Tax=Heterostelium pallidum (strain ATCC 26659 / Pp 5 / PN500) TaxID=670386 RepID=D3BNM6_HETP5|nr:hypothetical protein PPL_09729 [Heterostelium album PN500]EFA76977.1 hypothetical protein PPL_09729 [Heterostelium album PN500]|eukprot:XP_020429108.1 hypothetical protein PPL_09729 [Heterostelium album PN500]
MAKEISEFIIDNSNNVELIKSITCEKLEYPEKDSYFLRDVLSKEECQLVLNTLYIAPDAKSDTFNNKDHGLRLRRFSDQLSLKLKERIERFLPTTLTRPPVVQLSNDTNNNTPKTIDWKFDRISEEFKFIKYEKGQRFPAHTDGEYRISNTELSFLSVIFFLNDGGAVDFRGGDFRFLRKDAIEKYTPMKTITPKAGSVLIFPHYTWHDSTTIEDGIKYVIRSNLMFKHQ